MRFLLIALFLRSVAIAASLPPYALDKLDDTPDLTQSLPEAGLPGGGSVHCGLVAVSNAIVWLAKHGYERLASPRPNGAKAQGLLVTDLASKKYLKTSPTQGTDVERLLVGVSKYVQDKGYAFDLSYQGWEEHPARFFGGVTVPDLDWIKDGVLGDSGVWLKIGWYKYHRKSDEYRRFAGHWVTLVGYGKDQDGALDPTILVVHDPAPRSGLALRHDYVRAGKLVQGRLRQWRNGPTAPAKGYVTLSGGLKMKDGADFAILDGAVVLKMKQERSR